MKDVVKDKVSIIIPTKSQKNWYKLIKNFKSKIIETEIIFIGPITSNHFKNIPNVKIITCYLKPVQCLEIAARYASGNYIQQFADDCELIGSDDPIGELYKLAKKNPKNLISCKYSVDRKPCNENEYNYFPWDNSTKLPIAALIKKEMCNNNFYDAGFIAVLADIDLYLRIINSGYKIKYSNIFINENKQINKMNNLLPTYWDHDRKYLDSLWIKNQNIPLENRKLTDTRKKIFTKFSKNYLYFPSKPTGKWKYNNKLYFKIIDNYISNKIFFLINVLYSNTRKYFLNNLVKRFKQTLCSYLKS